MATYSQLLGIGYLVVGAGFFLWSLSGLFEPDLDSLFLYMAMSLENDELRLAQRILPFVARRLSLFLYRFLMTWGACLLSSYLLLRQVKWAPLVAVGVCFVITLIHTVVWQWDWALGWSLGAVGLMMLGFFLERL